MQDADASWYALTPREQAPYHARASEDTAQYIADLDAYNKAVPLSPSAHSTDVDSDLSDEGEFDHYDRYAEACRRVAVQKWNRYRRDHYKACGGALLPVPEQPFRFLDLPLELREKVYAMVVGREKELYQMPSDGSAAEKEGPVDVRIFAVSRQVFAESVRVFFNINILRVTISHDVDLPIFMSGSTSVHLKRVHLWISFDLIETKRWMEDVLKTVCTKLKKCICLRELRITAICQTSRVDEAKNREWDRMLELIAEIKPVDHVVFTDKESLWMRYLINDHSILGTPERATRVKQMMESNST
jgi:hypothetical protein